MKIFKGKAGAPGITAGRVLYYEKTENKRKAKDFDEAVSMALEKIGALHKKALDKFGEENAKIFAAYEMLLGDPALHKMIKTEIDNGTEAAQAVKAVTDKMASVLETKKNEYMRQRAEDIRYVGGILSDMLNGTSNDFSFPEGSEKYILAAYELTPVDTMLFDHSRLAGLVTEKGGTTSHTVILAKSMGIPAVVGAQNLKDAYSEDEIAFLDGYSGTLTAFPDEKTKEKYNELIKEEEALNAQLEKIKQTDAQTKDGKRIAVAINIGSPADLKNIGNEHFDGVGLFRTEFLYSSASEKPSQKEQYEAYKKVMDAVYPRPVTIRTIDVGGDKQISYLNMKKEENPFLGSRGIRLCMDNPQIFSEQIEAILTAGADKEVRIMLPMITSVEEIKKTREIIDNVKAKLDRENTKYTNRLLLGIMIETPAAAIMADVFAKYSDFFSIGTNDLVQYITASDRGNADVEYVYNPFNPAVLKMLAYVIKAGNDAKIEVSICGDLAANTDFTKLLLGMGLKKFSVPLPLAGRIKHKIAETDVKSAQLLAKKVLSAEDENEALEIIRKESKEK